jgi:DNA polymerase-3 subunit gamma/tau
VPQLARAWQLLLKALPEVQEAPDAAAAAEMALVRIAYAAELPPTDALIRAAASGAAASAPTRPMGHAAPTAPPPVPALRVQSGRADAAPARARAEPQEQPKASVAPDNANMPEDFRALVDLTKAEREPRLSYALEHYVHLVSYERGRIEMRIEPTASKTFPGDLSDKLAKWTGIRWVITVSGAPGEPTLAEQNAADDAARRASAALDPLLKAAMAIFPGAKVVAVRDREVPETESEPSEGS